MRGGILALALVLAALAAGCITPSPGSVSEASAPPTSAGDGSALLRVHVTDEPHGPPLAGAVVTVTTTSSTWWGDESHDALMLSTDADGVAEARVAPGSEARVVASLEGFTQETKRDVPVGGDGDASQIEMPLYRSHVTLWINGTLAPAAASLQREGADDFRWDPHTLQFGRDAEARRGYAARVVLLNVSLGWENTLTAAGDLGIGMGQHTDQPDLVQDSGALQLPPGHYQETMALTLSDLHRWQHAGSLYAGAGTGTAYVAPEGLPYSIKVDAVFDGDQALHDSPGFNQVWGALVALAGTAAVLGRRR